MIPASMASMMIGGSKYHPKTISYLAAMSSQPSSTRADLIDALIRDIDDAGLFSKLDGLYLHKAHHTQAARVNVCGSNDVLTVTGSPTFTTDGGVSGSTSNYYTMSSNINSLAYMAQNSAHVGLWVDTDTSANGGDCGIVGQNTFPQIVSRIGTDLRVFTNQSGGNYWAATIASGAGHSVGNRVTSSGVEIYRDGSSLTISTSGAPSGASAALPASPFAILRGGSTSGSRTLFASHLGSGLTSTEVADLYNALNTYLTSF